MPPPAVATAAVATAAVATAGCCCCCCSGPCRSSAASTGQAAAMDATSLQTNRAGRHVHACRLLVYTCACKAHASGWHMVAHMASRQAGSLPHAQGNVHQNPKALRDAVHMQATKVFALLQPCRQVHCSRIKLSTCSASACNKAPFQGCSDCIAYRSYPWQQPASQRTQRRLG
jgi:hypothetical protein